MPWRLSTAARNAAGDGLVDLLDQGGTATMEIRTGGQPTTADDAATGTLLGTVTFSAEAWADFASGSGSANAITSDTNADASGTAGYARLLNGDGSTHSDMDIGQDSGTLSFDDTSIVAGGTIAISSMTITQPAE